MKDCLFCFEKINLAAKKCRYCFEHVLQTEAGYNDEHLDKNILWDLKETRAIVESELIIKALKHKSGNISQAAATLNISRPTLYDLIAKYNIPVKQVSEI